MIDWLQVLLLSLIQGVTEFLPVSSSAHLILTTHLLGWTDQGLLFDIGVHAGTLLAVVFYFRSTLWRLSQQLLPRANEVRSELVALVIATLPVVCAGALLKNIIALEARDLSVIAAATLFFGLLLGWADIQSRHQVRSNETVTYRDALLIGLAQIFALIPGASRSGVTITAALFLGYNPRAATRFSFLLSIPVILGATLVMLTSIGDSSFFHAVLPLVVAFAVSGMVAYATIGLFMQMVEKMGLMPFVIYRLLLGGLLLLWAIP